MEGFCDEQTAAAAARTSASLVANVVDAVHVKAVTIQNITHLLSFYRRRNSGLASAVCFGFVIINKVFAENGSVNRIFHGRVFRYTVVRNLHGDQRRYAVNLANADVVTEILVRNGMTETNEAIAALLELLYRVIERKIDDGAHAFQIFKRRAHLTLVLRINVCELLSVKAHVERCVKFGIVGFSVFHGGQFSVHGGRVRQLIDVAAIKGNNSVVFLYLFLHSNPPFVSYLFFLL